MALQGCSQWSLKGHGNWERFLSTRRRPISFPSSRSTRRCQKLQAGQPCLNLFEGDGTTNFRNHLQPHEGQEHDKE